MRLEHEEIYAIGEIVATRYFLNHGWKFTSLRDIRRITDILDDLDEQYKRYPQMGRDWYVSNSANKRIHFCQTWKDLERLVSFLKGSGEAFNFILKIGEGGITLCVILEKNEELSIGQKKAIKDARDAGYSVYVFEVNIPRAIEFELAQATGAYQLDNQT
ncbi:MAG: hypothetical protein SVJ22_04145 [Halobacteriota archaeon]|nr:hypothetical protein [Halobacteriota archaeon]